MIKKSRPLTKKPNTVSKDLVILGLIISLFFGIFLGTRPLSVPDEGRYTEIPREMVETGDFVTPRLNGVKYFEKPPLVYWLAAASVKAFGINEWALRFWPAIFALFGCLATYLFGRRFYSRQTGIAASLILASSLLYYAHSRILILDMPVSVLLTGALFSFFAAVFEKNKNRKRLLLAGFFTFSAGALMTKGLLGIVLPGGIILLWSLFYKRYDALKLAFNPWGILLFLGLALPWHILASLRNPEFFDFYIIHEQILRFLTTVHKRSQPFWFFIPIIFLGLFPWIAFLHKALVDTYNILKTKAETHLTDAFLVIWIVFIFLFFSASSSKLIPYIVPVFPAFALLLGRTVSKAWLNNDFTPYTLSIGIFQGLASLLIIAAPIALYVEKKLDNLLITPYAAATVAILFIGLVLTFIYRRKNNIRALLLTVGLSSALMYIPLNKAWVHLEGRSIYPLAQELKSRLQKEDLVISWHRYYQDLSPYIERITYVVDYLTEMSFGAGVEDVSGWMLNEEGFKEIINSGKSFYIVTRAAFVEDMQNRHPDLKNLQIIARSGKDILLTNK
ncbi:MAG: phospholipid carrier-dependent glycosyltransferase [Alphaproteobacteria bacterium]|nr:phospholipid carrier-dependent glycosyltransferase [Alphaproteobacteria bacterium]NCQ66954.1 phospholipid carrier-dependent glycosyltransferase [Alphaproteobacteria bacterium]NCT07520.1 phospholipid carrier-dependent glycosyltransferase [Alphaproteobacteria bacterium]